MPTLLLVCNTFDVEPGSIVGVEISSLTSDLRDSLDRTDEGG